MPPRFFRQSHAVYWVFLGSLIFAFWLAFWISGKLPRAHDVLLIWLSLNLLWRRDWAAWLIGVPLTIYLAALVLLSPATFTYGYPDAGMIASVLETNHNEAAEFFDLSLIAKGVAIIAGFIATIWGLLRIRPTVKQRRIFAVLSLLLVVFMAYKMIRRNEVGELWVNHEFSRVASIVPFVHHHYKEYLHFADDRKQKNQAADSWQITTVQPRYKNYVLILGESASRNYLSAYGYPLQNSPFLSTAKGVKYTQMITPAAHTALSVPRLFTEPHRDHIAYENSVITLANKAGFKTYWLSNQEKIGEYDSAVSLLAQRSTQQLFLMDDPNASGYDSALLSPLADALGDGSEQPRLIVLHLIGSHPAFCRRLEPDNDVFDFGMQQRQLACYLSSLKQTDTLIAQIYQQLQGAQQPFSLIYVSDHGMKPLVLKHGISQDSLKVPLFKLSSDDAAQTVNDDYISGMSFIWLLSEWLGVQTQNQAQNAFLQDYHYPSMDQIWTFDGKLQPYQQLESFDDKVLLPDE